jgi:hypothetical protein
MDGYLNKNDLEANKRLTFSNLRDALQNLVESSKQSRINEFRARLNNTDKEILFSHRTDAWKRYLSNVFSFVFVVPAVIRVSSNYSKYNTVCFWRPDSEKAARCATDNVSSLGL